MADLATAVFYLAAGLGLAMFLGTWLLARPAMTALPGRLFGLAMLAVPAGFVMLANGTQAGTLNEASGLLLAGGALFALGGVLLAAGLILSARSKSAS